MIEAEELISILLEDKPLFDPDAPADPKAEVNRLLPTKTVVLSSNDFISAPGMISAALHGWRSRSKKQRDWALKVVHIWPGLTDRECLAILNKQADIQQDGGNVKVTFKLWQ